MGGHIFVRWSNPDLRATAEVPFLFSEIFQGRKIKLLNKVAMISCGLTNCSEYDVPSSLYDVPLVSAKVREIRICNNKPVED